MVEAEEEKTDRDRVKDKNTTLSKAPLSSYPPYAAVRGMVRRHRPHLAAGASGGGAVGGLPRGRLPSPRGSGREGGRRGEGGVREPSVSARRPTDFLQGWARGGRRRRPRRYGIGRCFMAVFKSPKV